MIIRSGNIMNSTGSVLQVWQQQITEYNEITVTDFKMERYFTSVDNVVRLIIAVFEQGENGKIYITPRGEKRTIKDLAEEAIRTYGNDKTKIKKIGKRPGERLHEKLSNADEKNVIAGFEDIISPV